MHVYVCMSWSTIHHIIGVCTNNSKYICLGRRCTSQKQIKPIESSGKFQAMPVSTANNLTWYEQKHIQTFLEVTVQNYAIFHENLGSGNLLLLMPSLRNLTDTADTLILDPHCILTSWSSRKQCFAFPSYLEPGDRSFAPLFVDGKFRCVFLRADPCHPCLFFTSKRTRLKKIMTSQNSTLRSCQTPELLQNPQKNNEPLHRTQHPQMHWCLFRRIKKLVSK